MGLSLYNYWAWEIATLISVWNGRSIYEGIHYVREIITSTGQISRVSQSLLVVVACIKLCFNGTFVSLGPSNFTDWWAGNNRLCNRLCYIPLAWYDKYLRDFKRPGFYTSPHHRAGADVVGSVVVWVTLQIVGSWQMCWSRSLCLHQEFSASHTPTSQFSLFLTTFFFFFCNTCLSSSRKSFDFPQGKFHVANLFSAVFLANTTTFFTLLFGEAHDIYVNTVLAAKA